MELRDLTGLRLGSRRRELLRRLWRREGWGPIILPGTDARDLSGIYESAAALIKVGLVEKRKRSYGRASEIRLSPLGEELCGSFWNRLTSGAPMQWGQMRRSRHRQQEQRAA